jgi:Uma2 family endonuclease
VRTQVCLTPKDQGRPLTLDEFEHAAGREGYRYELINGRVEVSPIPDYPHESLCQRIERLLLAYAEHHPERLQDVKGPARVFVPGRRATTAPEPDVAAYRDFPTDRPRSRVRWQDLSPVLVVEVLSADSADKDLVRNRRLYLQVPSIREYWIVDPRQDADRPSLTVYRRRGARWQRPLRFVPGTAYTTPLLPGFVLDLADADGGSH